MCIPSLVTTFPEWLSGTEPLPHTPGAVIVVFVVFCVHVYNFAGLIRRTPPPAFSDTAITDRHSDTTNFQLRAHWVRISWSVGSEKFVRTYAPGKSRILDFLCARRAPYPLGQALRCRFKPLRIDNVWLISGLTHSYLETRKMVTEKQCRPRSVAT